MSQERKRIDLVSQKDYAIDQIGSGTIRDIDLPDIEHLDYEECKSKELNHGLIHEYLKTVSIT